MVLYFSGTGNSKYCADVIARRLNQTAVDCAPYIKNSQQLCMESEDAWVFCAPTYAWQLPRVFANLIKNAELSGSKKAYFVMTCGSEIGAARFKIEALCREKGLEFMGVHEAVMPENYLAMFSVPKEKTAVKIVHAATPALEAAAEKIANSQRLENKKITLADRVKSAPVNLLFYPLCVKAKDFYAKDNCVACGKCAEVCPLNNIKIVDNKPVWGKDCTHCMACICRCPVEAIEYGKKSEGKRRYICPDFAD